MPSQDDARDAAPDASDGHTARDRPARDVVVHAVGPVPRGPAAEAMLAAIVRSSNDAIYAVDEHGLVLSWNPAAERLLGFSAEEVLGMPVDRILPPQAAQMHQRMREAVVVGQLLAPWQATLVRRDGSLVEASLSMSVLPVDGGPSGVAVIARDNTERKRFEAQLRQLADHDAITGLFNRRRFDEELARIVALAARYGEHSALLLLDIDDFKSFNDTLGHAAGDELLRRVAAIVRERVRVTDVVARVGGDEFALLLPRAGATDAERVAEDLVLAVRQAQLILDGHPVRVAVSVGAVTFDGSASADQVLRAADRAMYTAKQRGRDGFVVATS